MKHILYLVVCCLTLSCFAMDEEDNPDSVAVPILAHTQINDDVEDDPAGGAVAPIPLVVETVEACCCSVCFHGIKGLFGSVLGGAISYGIFLAEEKDAMNEGTIVGVTLFALAIILAKAWRHPDVFVGMSTGFFVVGFLCYFLMSPISNLADPPYRALS